MMMLMQMLLLLLGDTHQNLFQTHVATLGSEWQNNTHDGFSQPRHEVLLHVRQLILHSATVTTIAGITPGQNGSITKHSGKSAVTGLDLLQFFS